MDRLATLAVEAVRVPEVAVQVYWLCLASAMLQDELSSRLSLEGLIQQALRVRAAPAWALPLASQALVQLLRAGDLLVGPDGLRHPPHQAVMWDEVVSYRGGVVSVLPKYSPYITEIQEQMCRLWQAMRRLYGGRSEALPQVPEEVRRGAVLFDARFYFACHEYFETLWGRVGDMASDFYQGLIQVAVAMRHLESHNVRGAVVLLHSGLARLRRYPANYKGLTLSRFLDEMTALLHCLQTQPDAQQYQFDPTRVPRLLEDME
jgi:predicted metal-dependent hydrolase